MPVIPTYPGVYIEELPSGVRTIAGVATSITAFVGFALKGATNEPIRIQNFGDFERQLGGLWLESTLSYAVQQFFLNGGSDALIVRLSNPGSRATTDLGALKLEAKAPGIEGNSITVTIDTTGIDSSDPASFNLTVKKDTTTETFSKLTASTIATGIKSSKLIRVKSGTLASRPDLVTDQAFANGGEEGGKVAKISLPVTKDKAGTAVTETLVLEAASEGSWGNALRVFVDYETADPDTTFNLTAQTFENGESTSQESFRNLSMDPTSSRYVADVLKLQSTLARVATLPAGGGRPDETPDFVAVSADTATRGADGIPPIDDGQYLGSEVKKTGLYSLEKADLFNLLCIPPVRRDIDISESTWTAALEYCSKRRAMLLIDPPLDWDSKDDVTRNLATFIAGLGSEKSKRNAALFFPRVKLADPLKENRLETFAPCGAIAGTFARTDAQRGVWKAPAGIEAGLSGVRGLPVPLTDGENGILNPLGVNCLRFFPVYGNVVWGARTLAGDDRLASEWKYIPVRRLALYLQESLYRGTQWVVFEPNDEPLWAQIRLNLGAFMNNLFRQGAFQGKTPRDAYFVKCDSETTTQNDINQGIVNIVIGFAPLKPAEFVILKFQQMAGQIAT
jgi:uncharacterized protein